MTAGDIFKTDGYDLRATAMFADGLGEAIVLNNNSTHFLVAIRPGDDGEAQLLASFYYKTEAQASAAYADALDAMILEAKKRYA